MIRTDGPRHGRVRVSCSRRLTFATRLVIIKIAWLMRREMKAAAILDCMRVLVFGRTARLVRS